MAGDWIKMRSNLWDDPRVSRLCDLASANEAVIIGGLYWLWTSADQHSTNGLLSGLTSKAIDRKSGIKGFGDALITIGWVSESAEGVQIVRFEEHNGKSAKRRCAESVRKMSAREADKRQTKISTHAHLEKREERREESKPPYPSMTETVITERERGAKIAPVDLETGEVLAWAN